MSAGPKSVTIARRLQLLAGVRLDWFSRSDAWAFNPRASARFELHPRIALRAGVGQYTSQPRGYVILPGFGNPDLRPEAWLHASAGVQMDVIAGALELTSDLFTKFADETAAPSTRLIERDGQRVSERFANTGSARVIGAEWLLRLRPGRVPFFAWLSYTFQQAERRDALGAPWYTSPWDQTHLLTFVAGALLPRGWEVGLRVRYTTGSPEPRVTGALYDSDHDVSLTWVDTLRPGRMPDFFMLDARVAKRFRWGPVAMQVIVEVLNATNQANVESRVYSYDRRSSVPVTGTSSWITPLRSIAATRQRSYAASRVVLSFTCARRVVPKSGKRRCTSPSLHAPTTASRPDTERPSSRP
jgi:hypothetical protein